MTVFIIQKGCRDDNPFNAYFFLNIPCSFSIDFHKSPQLRFSSWPRHHLSKFCRWAKRVSAVAKTANPRNGHEKLNSKPTSSSVLTAAILQIILIPLLKKTVASQAATARA